MYKKYFIWNPATCTYENGEFAVSTIDDSVITCDEIINAANSVSTNVSCSVPINAVNTASVSFNDEKVRYKVDCCILHTFLLVVIVLFIFAINCCHYTKHRLKQKHIGTLTI